MSAVDTPESVRALADGIDHLQDSRQLRRHAAEVLSRYAALLAAPTQSGDVGEERLERATTLIFETMCQLAQDYDIPRETVWNDPDAMDAARETARALARLSAEEPQP